MGSKLKNLKSKAVRALPSIRRMGDRQKPSAKEHPIIYSAPMVLARKAGRKAQSRRIVTPANSTILGQTCRALWKKVNLYSPETFRDRGPDPFGYVGYEYLHARVRNPDEDGEFYRVRPKLDIGDLLWVRENYTIKKFEMAFECKGFAPLFRVSGHYDADNEKFNIVLTASESAKFRKRKRKTGRTPSIFMYRSLSRGLDEVTKIRVERVHAITERDVKAEGLRRNGRLWAWPGYPSGSTNPTYAYQLLFELLHGSNVWENNPWVWVYEFEPADLTSRNTMALRERVRS